MKNLGFSSLNSMSVKKNAKRKLGISGRFLAFEANYWLGRFKEVAWLIGDARSGTTWTMELLNHHLNYRVMFEPFNHCYVDEMSFITPQLYMNPEMLNPQLEAVASKVFRGRFKHVWSDSLNRSAFYNGLLIKDVWANLFASWAFLRFPFIKIIFLIRNPFAVALSKYKTSHWRWVKDPIKLLNQPDLLADHLCKYVDLIQNVSNKNDYILNQVAIWAILNLVPLSQFEPSQIHYIFYEDLYRDPNSEISKALKFINPKKWLGNSKVNKDLIQQPSRLAGKQSNILLGRSPINAWKTELTAQQIDVGLEILDGFGLGALYNEDGLPNRNQVERLQQTSWLKGEVTGSV